MTLLPKDDLLDLAELHDDKCISLYLPTHRAGGDSEQDRIRLKNLVEKADRQLQASGYSGDDIRKLLGPIEEEFVRNRIFWQYQLDGLCLLRSTDRLYAYRLPFSFEASVVVGRHFHIKPLLPMLSGNVSFYLLALHMDSVRVYQGTRHSMSYLQIEDLPEERNDLFLEEEQGRPLQWHTGTRVPGGHRRATARPAAFHGHAALEQREDDLILRHYRRIDQALISVLKDEQTPLLLAGEDKLCALYRSANSYPHLIEDEAINIMDHEPTAENRDLLDLAAVHTLFNNGLVYAVTAGQVPGSGNVAAIYRY